jgi:hypothetical protein
MVSAWPEPPSVRPAEPSVGVTAGAITEQPNWRPSITSWTPPRAKFQCQGLSALAYAIRSKALGLA